jgi:teichuronic acid exporter
LKHTELKSQAVSGSIWALLEKFSVQIMQFIVAVVLTRLLDPKDFGLIVLATIFSGISYAISDGGFEKTLIQKKVILPIQIDTIFYLNAILGALLTLVLYFVSPFIAGFFDEPNLTPVLRVISVGIFLNALSQVQRTLLMKELKFKKLSIGSIISSVGGGIVGITLAVLGYGVWALVYSALTAQFLVLLVFWIKSSWYPSPRFSFDSIKVMLPFGLNVLFSSILFYFIQQFSNFIIGKFFSGRDLGFVNRGSKTPEMITNVLHSVVLKISFPLFAKAQHDEELFNKLLKRLVQTIAFFSFPLLFFLFVNAKDIVVLLFTSKWLGSVVFLQIFCIVKIFDPLVTLFREVILAKGEAKLISKTIAITSALEVLLILAGVLIGLHYVIVALAISMAFQYGLYLIILGRRININPLIQVKWIIPYLFLSTLAALSCWLFDYFFKSMELSIIIGLTLKFFISVFTYVVGLFVLQINESSYFRLKDNGLLKLKFKI